MSKTKMIDIPGIPEFFMTEVGRTENVGGDCVRIYNCVERGGFLLPQCTVIIPARSLIVASQVVSEAAHEAFRRQEVGRPRELECAQRHH